MTARRVFVDGIVHDAAMAPGTWYVMLLVPLFADHGVEVRIGARGAIFEILIS